MRTHRRALPLVLALLGIAAAARAGDLTSASYRLRGLHPASVGPARLASSAPAPAIGSSGASLAQGDALGPAGSAVNLTTSWPGFWPLVAGALPALDADGDGRQTFLDPDDDGDGLLDTVETGTGVYVSPADTGTSPVDTDSDDDSYDDHTEVVGGSDPNDPLSLPVAVPALPWPACLALMLALALPGAWSAKRRK